MEKKYLISLIVEYQNQLRFQLKGIWDNLEFRTISYDIAACNEIIRRLQRIENKNIPVTEIVEDFVNEMDKRSLSAEDGYIYSCAYDTGMDILDQVISMYERFDKVLKGEKI